MIQCSYVIKTIYESFFTGISSERDKNSFKCCIVKREGRRVEQKLNSYKERKKLEKKIYKLGGSKMLMTRPRHSYSSLFTQ